MPRIAAPKKIRLNLEVSPATRARLEDLRARTDADSMVEVIRLALATYDQIVDARASGSELVARDKDGKETVLVLL